MPFILILLLLLTSACRSNEGEVKTATNLAQSTANVVPPILTQTLNPEAIHIRLESLPKPFATNSASQSPRLLPIPSKPTLRVPAGFQVNVYAEGLDRPRWLALTPTGEVLVTETAQNRITLLQDIDGDGIADSRKIFANEENGLDIPFGMAFAQNSFFLGNHNGVNRYSYTTGQQQLTGRGEQIASLPGGGYRQHWTRNVIFSPDQQKLYVSIGSRSNVDNAQNRPNGYYEDFLTGFLLDPSVPSTWGRPVGLLVLPDGSLLVTEEENGRIYRISKHQVIAIEKGGFYKNINLLSNSNIQFYVCSIMAA